MRSNRAGCRAGILGIAALFACACERPVERPLIDVPSVRDSATGAATGPAARERFEAMRRESRRPVVVFLGDSLTAGLSLEEDQAFPAVAGELLAAEGLPVEVRNAGVSGDTSAGGLARLDWQLRQRPDFLFLCLGANDGLRGQPVAGIEANLREIIERSRAAGVDVVLAGIRMPPNYGPEYAEQFEAIYPRLAAAYDLPFVPFLLEGVAAEATLNLPDGIHPNPEGHRIIGRTVADALAPRIRALHEGSAGAAG